MGKPNRKLNKRKTKKLSNKGLEYEMDEYLDENIPDVESEQRQEEENDSDSDIGEIDFFHYQTPDGDIEKRHSLFVNFDYLTTIELWKENMTGKGKKQNLFRLLDIIKDIHLKMNLKKTIIISQKSNLFRNMNVLTIVSHDKGKALLKDIEKRDEIIHISPKKIDGELFIEYVSLLLGRDVQTPLESWVLNYQSENDLISKRYKCGFEGCSYGDTQKIRMQKHVWDVHLRTTEITKKLKHQDDEPKYTWLKGAQKSLIKEDIERYIIKLVDDTPVEKKRKLENSEKPKKKQKLEKSK